MTIQNRIKNVKFIADKTALGFFILDTHLTITYMLKYLLGVYRFTSFRISFSLVIILILCVPDQYMREHRLQL